MKRRYGIISADGHNIEPPHIWEKYLHRRFAEHAPRLVKDPKGGDAWEFICGAEPMPIGLVHERRDVGSSLRGERLVRVGHTRISAKVPLTGVHGPTSRTSMASSVRWSAAHQ